jgi:hypothetical protein
MTLREKLEQLTNEELKSIMQEHIDWEANNFVPEDAQLRALSKEHYSDDALLMLDHVASEAFRVYALRAAGMR